MIPRPPTPTLFPYTTLFRSRSLTTRVDNPISARVDHRLNNGIHLASKRLRNLFRAGVNDFNRRVAHQEIRNLEDRKSTRLNSSHPSISYAVFCLKKKKQTQFLMRRKRNRWRWSKAIASGCRSVFS